jgi:polysaccharide biosynthesis transport protein
MDVPGLRQHGKPGLESETEDDFRGLSVKIQSLEWAKMVHKIVRFPTSSEMSIQRRPPASVMNSVANVLTPGAVNVRPRTDLGGLASILLRRWLSIGLITLTSLVLASLYLLMTPPTYSAGTTLFIDPRPKKIIVEDTAQGGFGTDLALLESQVAIIRSDGVLSRVVDKMKLDEDDEFAPAPGRGLGARVKALLGIKQDVADPKTRALASLAQRVTVKRAQKTYVVEIEATSSQPVKAARITQAIVDAYLADQSTAKSDEAQRANAQIDGRLGELREQVRKAETRVDEFRKSNRILTSEGGTVGEQQLTRLNSELITARSQAAEARARLDEVQAAAKSGNPDVITDPAKTALLQRLREQLAQVARREASLSSQLLPRHPVLIDIRSQTAEIKSQITAELKRLAANAKADFQVSESRERELSKVMDATKSEVGRTNTAQIKQRELEQEVAASRELLRVFLARSKETDEQQKITVPDARMISPPSVPTRPVKPNPMLILALGLLGGLAAGVARALVLDHADSSLKSSADIESRTGLRTIAWLPEFKVARAISANLARKAGRPPTRLEASVFGTIVGALSTPRGASELEYRQATMGLLNRIRGNAAGHAPHVVLLAGASEGTGTGETALALSHAATGLGDRVLLIDAASANTVLSDALAGPLPTNRAIVLDSRNDLMSITSEDARTGLMFLPIALADLRSLKSLQRVRLLRGLGEIAKDFDLVVVDGGSLVEDESANIVLPFASEVIVIARGAATKAEELMAASQQLDRARDRISGVVLTRYT